MFDYIVLIILVPTFTVSIPYGIVYQAQLITTGSVNIWLYNQSSWSQCMCRALRYDSPSIVAFNSFSQNKTCQLITNNFSSSAILYMISSPNSTLFILKTTLIYQLESICCANISWLMNKIQQSNTLQTTKVIKPVGLTSNTDLNMLIVIYGNSSTSIQQRALTANMTGGRTVFTKMTAQPVSYHEGFYYVGSNPPDPSSPYYLYVYNTSFSRIANMSFNTGGPQRAVWLYNSSLMCVILQQGQNSSLAILNWYSPLYFTWNRTISVPFDKPYGLAKSNDDKMVYVTGDSATIYQLSTVTFAWSILVLNENSTEIAMSLIIDSCGNRLWALMLGFGIRVYDRLNGSELASWNMSMSFPTLYDMVLTSDYELYLAEYSLNELIHYGTSLQNQCTIN